MNDSVEKLHSDFGAFAVTFSKFQIIQDELLTLIFNGGLYGIFGIIYIFHYILVSQFHTTDTDGTFLFLGDLIDGEAQEKSSPGLQYDVPLVCQGGNVYNAVVAATVRLVTSNSPPSTTFNMDWAVAKITRHRFSSFWLVMYMISSFF